MILNIRRLGTPRYLSQADISTLWDQDSDGTTSLSGQTLQNTQHKQSPSVELQTIA